MSEYFDAVILGGGVSGWTMAAVLARAGVSVAILVRNTATSAIGEFLPPEGCMAIETLGLSEVLEHPSHRASPGVISVWGLPDKQFSPVMTKPGGRAFCLDRGQLQEDLKNRALADGARVFTLKGPPTVRAEGWAFATSRQEIRGRLLIDASGRASSGGLVSGATVRRDDGLIAVASIFLDAPCDDANLVVESLANGWSYAAPLTHNRQVAVVLTDSDKLPRGDIARAEFAIGELAATDIIATRLKGVEANSVQTFAAWSQITEPSAGSNWAAIGDAAMAFDPLGSAGLTKALRDVAEVSEFILQNRISDLQQLLAIRRQRYVTYRQSLAEAYASEMRYTAPFWERRIAPVES